MINNPFDEQDNWEPRSVGDWISRDPFLQKDMIRSQETDFFTEVFNAWRNLPRVLRRQTWYEREVAASLFELVRNREIPGLRAIGVGNRWMGRKRELVGLLLFEQQLYNWFDEVYESYDLPRSFTVNSLIRDLSYNLVNTFIEYESPPVALGQVPPTQFFLQSDPAPPSLWPTIQAGDPILGETPAGFHKHGTLAAIVSKNHSDIPLLLGAHHVLGDKGANVSILSPGATKVGKVLQADSRLDASLVELHDPWSIDYRIKNINLVPANPVIPYADMAVQFTGGASGHQTGWLDVVNSIPANGHAVGIIPHFRASIPANPGDSGALLLSGHGHQNPINPTFAAYMNQTVVDSFTGSMLGLLVAGPGPNQFALTRPQVYFTPIVMILSHFNIQPWVR